MRRPWIRALQGIALSVGSPLGWLGLRVLGGADPWDAFGSEPGVYAYMFIGSMLTFACFGAYLGWREEEYLENSLHDELTGLHNTRYFRRRLAEEQAFAARHQRPLGLLIGDIDFFKRVNDAFGHAAGDQALVAIAKAMMSLRRRGDTVARVGGEEFAVILPETELAEAVQVAERLRRAVAALHFTFNHKPAVVTISLGVAVSAADRPVSADELFRRADAAMYQAKRAGRDRVATEELTISVTGASAPHAT